MALGFASFIVFSATFVVGEEGEGESASAGYGIDSGSSRPGLSDEELEEIRRNDAAKRQRRGSSSDSEDAEPDQDLDSFYSDIDDSDDYEFEAEDEMEEPSESSGDDSLDELYDNGAKLDEPPQ